MFRKNEPIILVVLDFNRGRFHQHFFVTILRKRDDKLFRQMTFGKKQTNLAKSAPILAWNLEFYLWVKLIFEYFVRRQLFAWQKKVWWNRPIELCAIKIENWYFFQTCLRDLWRSECFLLLIRTSSLRSDPDFQITTHRFCHITVKTVEPSSSRTGMNFTNMFTQSFCECRSQKAQNGWWLDCIFLCFYDLCTLKLCVKCWWNWLQESITPTVYKKLFHTRTVFFEDFLFLQWVCVIFLAKKLAQMHKMLVKLTTGQKWASNCNLVPMFLERLRTLLSADIIIA